MPLTRTQKEEAVQELTDSISNAGSAVFVNFHGLSVDEVSELRNQLREHKVTYKVVKKTLTHIALENSDLKGEKPAFERELAIAFSDDLLEPARNIYEFQKKFEDKVSIIGGIFDGAYMDKEQMLEVAQIPPHDTLKGMFVNVINSPIQGFVSILNQVAETKEA